MSNETSELKWKKKYFETLDKLEHHEKKLTTTEGLLRLSVSRISLAAEGNDDQIDRALKHLRDSCKLPLNPGKLQESLNSFSLLLAKLEHEESKTQTRPQRAPEGEKQALAPTEPQKESKGFSFGQLFSNKKSAAGEDNSQAIFQHFLNLLYERIKAVEITKLNKALTHNSSTKTLEKELRACINAIDEHTHQMEQAPRAEDNAREILIQLLDLLTAPPSLADKLETIKDKLANETNTEQLKKLLRAVADLVAEMLGMLEGEKADLEEFLIQITKSLQEFDLLIAGTSEQRSAWLNSDSLFAEKMEDQVITLEQHVQNSTNLDSLKGLVQERLTLIKEHLTEYRDEGEKQQQQLADQVKLMKSQLSRLEHESQALRNRLEEKQEQMLKDALTGIHNRFAYEERVKQEVARWKRYQEPLALLVIDVDHFKSINDSYGHKAGDNTLRHIAEVLQENIRETDFLARYGGEEFVVIILGAGEPDLHNVAEKLRTSVEKAEFSYQGKAVDIRVSGGYTLFKEGDTAEKAFVRADKALYEAKKQGRNRVMSG